MNRFRQLLSDLSPADRFGRSLPWNHRLSMGLASVVLLFVLLATRFGDAPLGKKLFVQVSNAASSMRALMVADTTSWDAPSLSATPVLRNLPSHPANKLSPYMSPGVRSSTVANPTVLFEFHDLLELFTQRQARDDNFTVRVIDRRTDEVLELYQLTERRQAYQQGERVEWRLIDDRRRKITRRLVDKYERRGVPLEDIIVRWGRANQITQAQERDRPYQAYEIQLAQSLGLSLLASQIGAVETFNQDDLVSPAGAKSRYQMMPWILRRSGVNEYALPTAAGPRVDVEEAYHPLLTLEPAFLLLRGYVNAVGHEIPGLSAYHTGPGNIYMLYRKYFTESTHYEKNASVVDAYIWALTEGFDVVSEETSFGPFSRGYVPSLYGALEAQSRSPVDLSETIRTARVQLKPGARVSLQEILSAFDASAQHFNWGPAADEPSSYARFRALNKHFDLPASDDGGVPPAGNVQFVSTLDGKAVRFFLPPEGPRALRQAGLDVLAPDLTFRCNESTYAPPSQAQQTKWDRRYDRLVRDIEDFGVKPENRDRLLALHDKFQTLAEETPSHYRKRQLKIIDTHRRIWLSNPWDKLSELTLQVTGRGKVPAQPPVDIPTRPLTRIP